MLNLLDNLLRKILMEGVAQLRAGTPAVNESQVGFAPPDDRWRAHAGTLDRNALNVYLVDLRENRKLRSRDSERRQENGIVYDTPAPMWLDCHYLVSAWSPSDAITPSLEPALDEHILLYQTAGVLANVIPFVPASHYPAGSSGLNAWPQRFQNVSLPAAILPTEGFPKLAEFWGTMGGNHRWKPVVYLIVTIPVELTEEISGALVTTRITEFRQVGVLDSAEVWIQIGGTLYDKTGQPVPHGWVRLETTTSAPVQTTASDAQGRFTFKDLPPGQFILRARAMGLERTRTVEVPSPTGEYDLKLP